MHAENVFCFVFDTLADWEAGHAIAGINTKEFQKRPGRYRVSSVAKSLDPVTTAGGLRIQPDLTLEELHETECRMLILPGGKTWDEGANMESVEAARSVLAGGGAVAAICGGTAGLAKGGLLDRVRHTSNAREYLALTEYKGGALYEDAPAVTDGSIVTASSTAPVDFAFHVFQVLDLYAPETLQAWYGLFKTGKPEYFEALAHETKS